MVTIKYIAIWWLRILIVLIFTSGTVSADSSYRQYLQYKNSETYKMIHGLESKDTDSEKKSSYGHSQSKYNATNDNNHGGNKEVSDSDYYTLLSIVGEILMVCIKKNSDFQTQKGLMNWIEEIKLT